METAERMCHMGEGNRYSIDKVLHCMPGRFLLLGPDHQIIGCKGTTGTMEEQKWPHITLFKGTAKTCNLYYESDAVINVEPVGALLELLLDEWVVPYEADSLIKVLTEPYRAEFEEEIPGFLKTSHSWRLGTLVASSSLCQEVQDGLGELMPDLHKAKLSDEVTIVFLPSSLEDGLEWAEAITGFIAEDLMADSTLVLGLPVSGVRHLYSIATQLIHISKSLFHMGEHGVRLQETLPLENCLAVLNNPQNNESLSYLAGIMDSVFMDEDLDLTARTFLKHHLSVTDTAQALYLHRNTLVYRLAKIEKLTGLDLKKFDHAMAYYGLSRIRFWKT